MKMAFIRLRRSTATLFLMLCLPFSLLVGCNAHQLGVRAASGVMESAAIEMETESSYTLFQKGIPANIKTLEGLLYVDPNNEALLLALAKGYSAYGFGYHETEFLNDKFGGEETSAHRTQAIANYSKALRYSGRFLQNSGVRFKELQKAVRENRVTEYLDDYLDSDEISDLEAVFFAGQAWASLIHLQRDRVGLLAELDQASALIDWVCEARPDFQFGSCAIFYGTLYSSRPKMLGGDPDKGRQVFEKAISTHPQNMLLRLALIEHYAIPAMEQNLYNKQKEATQRFLVKQIETASTPGSILKEASTPQSRLNLYNAIAKRRLHLIEKQEEDLF